MQEFDIHEIIVNAKLGGSRKDAQIDSCTAFAAALYDVLSGRGHQVDIECAVREGGVRNSWAHSVVRVGDVRFDSMGKFDEEIWRKRAKIHPSVKTSIRFESDLRDDLFDEDDFGEMYKFFVKELDKSIRKTLGEPAPKRAKCGV